LRTLGFAAFAFQATAAPDPGTGGVDFVKLIADGTWLSKSVLLILLLFSAVSWGIVVLKIWQYRRAARDTGTFLQVFRKSTKFSEVQSITASVPASPLVGIFQAGYAELNTQLRQPAARGPANLEADAKPSAGAVRPTLRSLDAVDRALLRATSVEVSKLEKRVPFLATTASITPFIGLFGTVIGIINAFRGMAVSGSGGLGAVSAGIAEALFATAIGLFVAVPAVWLYNYFLNVVDRFGVEMQNSSSQLIDFFIRNEARARTRV
jgi:biopolymer transport protein TolQ